jgi:hypothetical protein
VRLTTRAIAVWLASAASPASADPPLAPPSATRAIRGPIDAGQTTLGGALGITATPDVRDVSAALAVGRFVADGFALSAITSVARVETDGRTATLWSMIAEPSYHLPLGRRTFGVLGMGVGMAYVKQLGAGFAVAPRIGASFALGRRSVVTPALAYEYVTHRALDRDAEPALVAVTGALRIQLGYAATW